MEIGENIRTIRLQKGMTQKQVADICGMADSAIRKYESGQIVPKISTIQRIASALGVDPYSLYSFDQATEALEERINAQDARERVATTMEQLSPEGQVKVADYAEDILPRYQVPAEDD